MDALLNPPTSVTITVILIIPEGCRVFKCTISYIYFFMIVVIIVV